MLCSMAMRQEFTTTGLTARNKFIGFVVLVIKKYNSYEEGIAAFKSRTHSNPPLAHDDDFYLQNPTAAPPSSPSKLL